MKKEVDYGRNIKDSFRLLINNKILFFPDLLFYLFSLIIGYYFLHFNGLLLNFNFDYTFLTARIKEIISNSPSFIKLVYSAVAFILFSIILGIGTTTLKKVMISTLTKNKKIKLSESYKSSSKFWFRLFLLRFILSFLVLFVFFIFFIIGVIIVKFRTSLPILWMALLGLLFILLVLSSLYLKLIFLFVDPIMFLGNKSVFNSIKVSIDYFKINRKNVYMTFLITLAISMGAGLVIFIIFKMFDLFSVLILSKNSILFAISLIIGLIKYIITISFELFNEIFLFKNY